MGGMAVHTRGSRANTGEPPKNYEPFYLKEKIGDMIKYGYPILKTFPRRDMRLADEIRGTMLTMYRLAIEIEKKYYRKTTTQELDVELDVLRHLVRLASDRDVHGAKFAPPLSLHQYEVWAGMNTEIGNILGGYIKSLPR